MFCTITQTCFIFFVLLSNIFSPTDCHKIFYLPFFCLALFPYLSVTSLPRAACPCSKEKLVDRGFVPEYSGPVNFCASGTVGQLSRTINMLISSH